MSVGVPRVHANGLRKVFSSVLELTLRKITIAQVVVGLPVPLVAFRRPLKMSHSPVIVALSLEGQNCEIVSFCVIRQVFESLQSQPVCFFQFARPPSPAPEPASAAPGHGRAGSDDFQYGLRYSDLWTDSMVRSV